MFRSNQHPVPDDAFRSHTSAAPMFQRPRRFLLLAREKLEPAATTTTTAAQVTSRPGSRRVDIIESDVTPPEPASRQQIVPQSRKKSNHGPGNRSIESASSSSSRVIQRPIPQSRRASNVGQVDIPVAATSTSRISQQSSLQPERNTGPSGLESGNTPLASANRGSRPLPLPGMRNPGSTTAPTTSTSSAAYQPSPHPVRHAGPTRTPVASTSRVPQQSMHQPTRNALSAHTSTSSVSRMAQQPTIQPPRTSVSTHTPSASLSRTPQQSTLRSARATAVPLNTPSSSASAPILEFICLYTHDLRRKKKRWQDGKLKFHTFNQKYMVYDDGGGFVGDGHWQGDASEITEGLEMNLDRGMAIVQVLECTGSKEQDLGEVLGKRVREVEERRASAAAKVSSSTAPAPAPSNPAKRSRVVAVAVEPPRAATLTNMVPLPPRNGGAWSTHAMDLLGMTRPRRE